MSQVSDILDRAADLIEPHGKWARGGYEPRQGCFCVLGAISVAAVGRARGDWGGIEMLPAVRAGTFLLDLSPDYENLGQVVQWNDSAGRTQGEVVSKLRERAAAARERGL